MIDKEETTMASNEEIVRNLYAVAKGTQEDSVTVHRERLLVGDLPMGLATLPARSADALTV
jgi:hypothetical protein